MVADWPCSDEDGHFKSFFELSAERSSTSVLLDRGLAWRQSFDLGAGFLGCSATYRTLDLICASGLVSACRVAKWNL